MDFNEYQKLAMRTAKPECYDLRNAALGLTGESGEFAELVKKHLYHGKPWNREQALAELGDALWYIALAAETIGSSLSTVAQGNVEKLQARYPSGFVKGGGVR